MPFPKNSTTKTTTPFKPTTHTPKVNVNTKVNAKIPPVQLKVVTSATAATTSPVSESNEENVRPTVGGDEQANKLEPLSPLPLSGTGFAKAQERDVRAYEHDRQRSKRAEERAIRRAKKASGMGKGKGGAAAVGGRTTDMGDPRKGRKVVDIDVDAVLATAPGAVARGYFASALLAPPKKNSILSTDDHSDPSREVNLSDLVVLSQRKPRKLKEGDFEFVPALPTVIALDDMPELDMAVDEPWECVDGEDTFHDVDERDSKTTQGKKGEQSPSYAKVLLGA